MTVAVPGHGDPLRVTIVGHSASLSGAELSLLRLLPAIDPVRVAVHVILLEDGPLVARLRALGVAVSVLRLGRSAATTTRGAAARWRALLAAPAAALAVVRLAARLRRTPCDLVVSTTMKAHVLAAPAALMARRRLAWHLHDRVAPDYLPGPVVRGLRWLARHGPGVVVANSAATAATVPGARTVVAYPGIGSEHAIADPEHRRVPDGAGPVALLLGRVSPTKGQLELVQAASRVLEQHPRARFRIVGDPMFGAEDYAARVDAEIRRLHLSDRVRRLPAVADPRAELDAATLLVHASPVPEPFGQVIVEAMVRGVPVVATRAGGVPEILEPPGSQLGLLVPPGDVRSLADAVVEALGDPDAAHRRAVRAHASAVERFQVEAAAEVVTAAWTAAARSGRARQP